MENIIINADFRTKEIIVAEIKTTLINIQETTFYGAIRIGQGLKELKKLVPHGELAGYIEENLGFSQRKFQQYTQFAEQYGDENSPYMKAVSNPQICADLSFSNALRLLAIPEDRVEDFVTDNDVSDMTVKELEKKVKELQNEIGRSKELEKLDKALSECNTYSKRENDLVEKINSLQESLGSSNSEKTKAEIDHALKEIDEAQKSKDAADERADKLQKQLDQFKSDQKKIIENEKKKAADNAKSEVKKEAEEEIKKLTEAVNVAKKEKQDAEKGLAYKEDILSFKIIVDKLQEYYKDAVNALETIKRVDSEKAENFRLAFKAVLAELDKNL